MRRLTAAFAVLVLLSGFAQAQNWNGPNPLREKGIGVMYWQHPLGDETKLPCAHLAKQHPGGHPTTVPCLHMEKDHPNDHPGPKVPCLHLEPEHPDGHPVMVACLHLKPNGKPKHPGGHQATTPCTHLNSNGTPKHSPHKVFSACAHQRKKHPNDHPGPKVTCVHLHPKHPGGHPGPSAPCAHLVTAHPDGHTGPNVPCVHPMPLKHHDRKLNLYFYSDDEEYQTEVIRVVNRIREMGIDLTANRPLHLFYRPAYPKSEYPKGAQNPTHSHYNAAFHSVQVQPKGGWKSTLHHELGHATLGDACIRIVGGGGRHFIHKKSRPGVAIGEGWAHFVALVISNTQNTANPVFRGFDWEAGTKQNGDAAGDFSPNIELRVGCTLWDLFDKIQDGDDEVSVGFTALFRVFSPTLAVLQNGPFVPDLADYLKRFVQRHPKLAAKVDKIRAQNTATPANRPFGR